MKKSKVIILGQEYDVIDEASNSEYGKLQDLDGYASFTTKKIVVAEFIPEMGTDEDISYTRNHVMRHEVIHAFLCESGMRQWAEDEQLVDWMAAQFPKIQKVFQKLHCKNLNDAEGICKGEGVDSVAEEKDESWKEL